MWSTSQVPLDSSWLAATVATMLPLATGVQAIPLRDTTPALITECMDAVSESLRPGSTLHATMVDRWQLSQEGQFPDALWLLQDTSGAAGWVGWAPYQERAHTWQTTTYFAPRLRGLGLLDVARCLQVHSRENVRTWQDLRGEPQPTFLSSIASWNERSLRASTRYALRHDWPNTWVTTYEPIIGRHAWVFEWPATPTHTCRLGTLVSAAHDATGSNPMQAGSVLPSSL